MVHPLSPRNAEKPRRRTELPPKVPRAVVSRPGLCRPVPGCRERYRPELTLKIELFLIALGALVHQLEPRQALFELDHSLSNGRACRRSFAGQDPVVHRPLIVPRLGI